MGGGTEVDSSMQKMCDWANGGDFLVIRATGTDAYNPYLQDICPGPEFGRDARDPVEVGCGRSVRGADHPRSRGDLDRRRRAGRLHQLLGRHARAGCVEHIDCARCADRRHERRPRRAHAVRVLGARQQGRHLGTGARGPLQPLHHARSATSWTCRCSRESSATRTLSRATAWVARWRSCAASRTRVGATRPARLRSTRRRRSRSRRRPGDGGQQRRQWQRVLPESHRARR